MRGYAEKMSLTEKLLGNIGKKILGNIGINGFMLLENYVARYGTTIGI